MVKNEALPAERIRAVETGGCPHAAIREVKQFLFYATRNLFVSFWAINLTLRLPTYRCFSRWI